jgi:two-component system OmpR family response regulator
MSHQIAIVEDDPDQSRNYADALTRQGYQVQCYASRAAAERAFANALPDLAILDIMLGEEMDGGFTLCRHLLARKADLPVIFLTSRADEIDRISGLRLGAWDYQTKPVSLQFLAERVGSLLRILGLRDQAAAPSLLQLGALELDEDRLQVRWQGQALTFTFTEFNLLLEMVRRRDERGASYDQLAQATRQGIVENNTINTHIRHLRRKFRELDAGFDCIRNVYGFGYRWSDEA